MGYPYGKSLTTSDVFQGKKDRTSPSSTSTSSTSTSTSTAWDMGPCVRACASLHLCKHSCGAVLVLLDS